MANEKQSAANGTSLIQRRKIPTDTKNKVAIKKMIVSIIIYTIKS